MKAEKRLPKVLITCIDSWRGDVGANTLPNFFKDWDPDRIAVVYTRSEKPTLPQCNHYFQISESEILHSFGDFRKKIGNVVERECETCQNSNQKEVEEERNRINRFRNINLHIFQIARDLIWGIGQWKSPELKAFLKDFNPDVIFFPVYPYVYMNRIQNYIANTTNCRGVAYIADDNYSYKPEWYNPMFLLRRFFLRRTIDTIIRNSNELLVILPFLKEEYSKIWNLPINILSKGINLDAPFERKEPHHPIKMIYTGNLFIGRDKTMIKVANAINSINRKYGETRIILEIYSHIQYSDRILKKLNIPGSCEFRGAVSVEESRKLQKAADIVLFVEGTDIFNRNKARLSFSTKLTDYFKAGKCIFAVGPRTIAPINYLENYDAALVAENEKEIITHLENIVEKSNLIVEYGEKAYELGSKNHTEKAMDETLYSALRRVAEY